MFEFYLNKNKITWIEFKEKLRMFVEEATEVIF